eukprot:CAMPEP_0183738104 /NCGR_PEP_ID=MMETSP0737-20130205/53768_1 /TAXON_ID=385413 /ORGANISM="Thalassiosira miniscula, Strain CCMP1093" /LENGTH=82 /DNA_ID=CAMNT_0025972555 /DNA_START=257 /DNA_END=505 /DNA_ORIENTATION=-
MLVFIQPKCLNYQKKHPGTNRLTAAICIIFPVDRLHSILTIVASSASNRNVVEEPCDDGIGFNNYNEEIAEDAAEVVDTCDI